MTTQEEENRKERKINRGLIGKKIENSFILSYYRSDDDLQILNVKINQLQNGRYYIEHNIGSNSQHPISKENLLEILEREYKGQL